MEIATLSSFGFFAPRLVPTGGEIPGKPDCNGRAAAPPPRHFLGELTHIKAPPTCRSLPCSPINLKAGHAMGADPKAP